MQFCNYYWGCYLPSYAVQIYDLETAYLSAEYSQMGTVLKVCGSLTSLFNS